MVKKPLMQILLVVFFASGAFAEVRPGERLRDYSFTAQDGRSVRLSEFYGRPLVMSFIYSTCAHTCGTLTESLSVAFDGQRLGTDFRAISVGFDHERDTPMAMKAYGERYAGDFTGWTFASADKKTIGALTAEAGFYFKTKEDGFDHPNMAIVIGPEGRVFKRLYGDEIDARSLRAAIVASTDPAHPGYSLREGGLLGLLQYVCYTYDEETGRYRLDTTFLVVIALGLIVQAVLVWFVLYVRHSVRKRESEGVGPPSKA